MSSVEQARIRISTLGGLVADLGWLAVARIPPGVAVEVVDFGYRVTVIVARGASEVTLVADLSTGDVAESSPTGVDKSLRDFARFVMAARMGVDGPDFQSPDNPPSSFAGTVEAAGAQWIPPYGAQDERENKNLRGHGPSES